MEIISTVVNREDRFLISLGKEELAAMFYAMEDELMFSSTQVAIMDLLEETLDAAFGRDNW